VSTHAHNRSVGARESALPTAERITHLLSEVRSERDQLRDRVATLTEEVRRLEEHIDWFRGAIWRVYGIKSTPEKGAK